MKNNYCQVGTPVQFMQWDRDGWVLWPAVIYSVNKSKVNVLVHGEQSSIEFKVRHSDFKRKGKDYWQYIPQQSPE